LKLTKTKNGKNENEKMKRKLLANSELAMRCSCAAIGK